jgi:uncharacterized phiE125 gp8 family phage protein
MWYPVDVATPGTEPVTRAQAKFQCRVATSVTSFDTEFDRLIPAARSHVEAVCGVRFAQRADVDMTCDSFEDFAYLPEGPISAAVITYVDTDGATQTLSTDVYELRANGLEASIVLKYNQSWPAIQPGSRITVTATLGATAPEAVVQAMLTFIDDTFHKRDHAKIGDWTVLDVLLFNHRRNA